MEPASQPLMTYIDGRLPTSWATLTLNAALYSTCFVNHVAITVRHCTSMNEAMGRVANASVVVAWPPAQLALTATRCMLHMPPNADLFAAACSARGPLALAAKP